MELFQFSNCTIYSDSCAFGEFGPPGGGIEPSIVYTATVTSLMCEEHVEDQYVCGLLHFLSNITDQGVEKFNVDFHGQISFVCFLMERHKNYGNLFFSQQKMKKLGSFEQFYVKHFWIVE